MESVQNVLSKLGITSDAPTATAYKVSLSPSIKGIYSVHDPTKESAEMASRLLQENHEKHDLFFNEEGFHNHIVHQVLTLYGLGAPAEVIKEHYDNNTDYQKPLPPVHVKDVKDMRDPAVFKQHLGDRKYIADYEKFFAKEIEEKGTDAVLQEWVFGGSEIAEDMLVRLFMGFLHPFIHLGFGLEFQQPSIVAEALASAAVHENWLTDFFHQSEELAKANGNPSKPLLSFLEDAAADPKIKNSAQFDDANKFSDGVLARAFPEITSLCGQYAVASSPSLPAGSEKLLRQKVAEIQNIAAYMTIAAQNPPKALLFDFYYMHAINCSIFLSTIIAHPALSAAAKRRVVEWTGRYVVLMYVSRHCAALRGEEIAQYVPRDMEAASSGSWNALAGRLFKLSQDDGHAVKLLRAVAHAAETSKEFTEDEGGDLDKVKKEFTDNPASEQKGPSAEFRIVGGEEHRVGPSAGKAWPLKDWLWGKAGAMVVDGVEEGHGREGGGGQGLWGRSVGWEEAWKDVPERSERRGDI
jgi:hypothetical protein